MRLDLGAANAIQTYNTVRELRAMRCRVRLVVPRWMREESAFDALGALHLPRPAVNKLSRIVPWAGWSYIERTLYAIMLVVLLVIWRLSGRGYRVLYVRDTVCAAWLCLLRWAHGGRIVYEVHDLEASHPSKASKWPRRFWARFLPWLDSTALSGACKVVSLTETFRAWAARRGLRDCEDMVVIPDAFDPKLSYSGSKVDARRELGLPLEAYVVGYAGLTFAYRGVDVLVRAFAPLVKVRRDAVLLLVGGRPHEVAEMRELAVACGIGPDSVVMPGQVEQRETGVYLGASDVLVVPDTVTGMTASPLKLFEYMAVGKPIVCKDMPALREIVDESCALFFQAGDADEMSRALAALKDDPELAGRMGREARLRSARYTYRGRAEKIVEVVESCR
jgi:glycosyltransferase involved in cell wall biosynthesis